MKDNLSKFAKLNAKKSALVDIQMALARGEVLHHEDQAIWDEGEDRIKAEILEQKEKDRKLRKEKIEIKQMIEKNEADLQKFCLNNIQQTYSYVKGGRYFRVGTSY